jgi:hypothetical protein
MTTIHTATRTTLVPAAFISAGRKASATKGDTGHKIAGIKAQLTRAHRLRDALTGHDKGLVTKRINALMANLIALGGHYDA